MAFTPHDLSVLSADGQHWSKSELETQEEKTREETHSDTSTIDK